MKGLMAKKCSKSKKEGKMSEDKVEMVKAFSSNMLDNEDQVIYDFLRLIFLIIVWWMTS